MPEVDPQLKIRLPREVKAFIDAQAQENASSRNSEIIRAIRAAMKAKGPVETAISPSQSSTNPQQETVNEPALG